MRAAGLLQTGLACVALSIAGPTGAVHAQSMLTYPGGMATVAPPSMAPVQPPPAALAPPPAATPPAEPAAAIPETAPSAPAPASSCDTDMMKLQEKRNEVMTRVNNAVKPNKKGQVDPLVACPHLKTLVAADNEMKGWMLKNQSWCGIPDQVIDQMKEGFGKTAEIADRACAVAAQVRKAQQQMRSGQPGPGAPPAAKLPTGPL